MPDPKEPSSSIRFRHLWEELSMEPLSTMHQEPVLGSEASSFCRPPHRPPAFRDL